MGDERYRESESGLPPLFTLSGFEGSLTDYLDALYGQYRAMVYEPGVRLWGKPLAVWGEPESDGRDEAFWHLITSGDGVRGRARRLDLMRCARLGWVASMLSFLAADDVRVCWWREDRPRGNGKGRRRVVWVADVDFRQLIRLDERQLCLMLGTAYPIGSRHRPQCMERAARAWEAAEAGERRARSKLEAVALA